MGKTINPAGAEDQIEGGVAQGIGQTLTEKVDTVNGEVIDCCFPYYKIPTGLDLPAIESILVESNEPHSPCGAKGLGEVVMVPTASAITNASYKSVGVRIKELPVTLEKILTAFKEKSKLQ